MVKPIISAEIYASERDICDKAQAYAERVMTSGSKRRNFLTKEEAAHPEYVACDNAMRSRVEQYELLTTRPGRFSAYVGKGGTITTFTGDVLGTATPTSTWKTPRSFVSQTMTQYRVTMAGRAYTGRCGGEGLHIALRAV